MGFQDWKKIPKQSSDSCKSILTIVCVYQRQESIELTAKKTENGNELQFYIGIWQNSRCGVILKHSLENGDCNESRHP